MTTEDLPGHDPRDITEEHSFDELARELANGTVSRRRALKLAGASFLGFAVPSVLLPGTAEARRRKHKRGGSGPRCSSGTGCDEQCTNTNKVCACVRTTEGARVCVHPCCSDRRCNSSFSNNCRSDEVCLGTNCGCNTGNAEGVCVKVCTGDRPNYCSGAATTADSTGGATEASGLTWNTNPA